METKKLFRSRKDKIISGVAGGLAEYFDVDPTLVRLIFLVLTIWGGVGAILYIILAIAVPEEPREEGVNMAEKKTVKKKVVAEKPVEERVRVDEDRPRYRRMQGEQLFGMIVLGLGLIFLLEMFIPGFSFGKLWPLILIGIGLWLIAGREER